MRVFLQTLGTRGDVQPFVALALGLMLRGHEVELAAPEQFTSFVERRGVAFAPLPGELLALLDTPEGRAAIAGGRGFGAGLKLLKHIRPFMRRLFDEEWEAAKRFGPDVIVHHPKAITARHIAERLGIPTVLASPLPGFTPTAVFPTPLLPVSSLGPFNKVSHLLATRSADLLFGKSLRGWRVGTLGLGPRASKVERSPVVYAYSRHVLPVPFDWGEDVLVSGYWFLDDPEPWQMSDDLAAFLRCGEKPIYVGFGSMPGIDPAKMARDVIGALSLAGKRGLLATGGGALSIPDRPSHVHVIDSAPHDRLFGLVGAAMHHGGAGTTGASLRAGLPTIICPFFGDQPFWARRVAALGVGPSPVDRRRLNVGTLAAAFQATDDPHVRLRASEIGAKIAAEDGVGAAVRYIERDVRPMR